MLDSQWDEDYPSNVTPKTLKLLFLCDCGNLRRGWELLRNVIYAQSQKYREEREDKSKGVRP